MSSPVPEFPNAVAEPITFSFGGYAAAEPSGLTGVGFWPRAGARFIDLLVHYCVAFFAGLLFSILLAAAAGGHIPLWVAVKLRHPGFTLFLFSLFGFFAYQVVATSVHGSSLGKIVLGMVVVQEDGVPCRFVSALIRELGYFIDSIFFGIVGYFAMQRDLKEQRYGDQWASTVVCRRSSLRPDQLHGGARFVLGLMLGTMADAALVMVGLLVLING
jgi:uncharacterized RDD family membrane protein YckC